jgi:hypothetical protein
VTQRKLLAVAGVALVVLSIAYVSRAAGHQPPYDANLVRLAESDLQGYCSGDTLMKSGGTGDRNMASQCRTKLARKRSDRPNLQVVLMSFCRAVVDNGWEGTVADCISIMETNQYWPTYDGTITNQWNRARPYPQALIAPSGKSQGGGSRTGGHHGPSRRNNPTHTVPTF